MFFNFSQARSVRIESCLNEVSSFNLVTLEKNEGCERSLDFFCFVFCVKTKNEKLPRYLLGRHEDIFSSSRPDGHRGGLLLFYGVKKVNKKTL